MNTLILQLLSTVWKNILFLSFKEFILKTQKMRESFQISSDKPVFNEVNIYVSSLELFP